MFERALTAALLGLVLGWAPARAAPELHDPTRPPDYRQRAPEEPAPAAQEQPLELASILIGPGRRVAVINQRLVREGDDVAGARVQSIERDRVILRRGTSELIVSLDLPAVKTAAPSP